MDKWQNVLSKIMSKQRKTEDKFIKKLGKPSLFIPNPEPFDGKDKSGDGYWRVKGGIIHYRFYPKGRVDLSSREEYTEEFIHQLSKLLKKEPIQK